MIMEMHDATGSSMRDLKIDLSSLLDSCRICMARNINTTCIFETSNENIIEEIHFCTGVTVTPEDRLPKRICTHCLNDLSIAFKFKTACLLAEETFHKLIVDENVTAETTETNDVESEEIITFEEEMLDNFDEKVNNFMNLESVPKQNKVPRRKKFKFKKLYCESCDIKFDNKQQCDQHKKEIHKESGHWVCEICGKLFIHRASHYTHIKSHMPPKYACDLCDYKTSHKYDLVKHTRRHTGTKMYQCEYCTASFYTSSNLRGHIRRNHMKDKPFHCNQCRMSFYDKAKLKRHVDSHSDIKRYECEVCHVCFTRRCYLKKHLLKQHDVITPAKRPGRQKVNYVVGEHLLEKVDTFVNIADEAKRQKTNSALSEDLFFTAYTFRRSMTDCFIQKTEKEDI